MIDELKLQYENLTYFDQDLKPIYELWKQAQEDETMTTQLLMDMLFVNKVNTISSNYDWIARHPDSEFKQKLFKQKLTCKTTITDEFGSVKGFGTAMTPEEWDVWEQFHDEVFKIEVI